MSRRAAGVHRVASSSRPCRAGLTRSSPPPPRFPLRRYAAASQQLAFCRGIHIWQHNALILDPTKPEEKIFFANSTVTVELPTEFQDFTDRMFHKRMEEVTVRPPTRCRAAPPGD